MRSSTLLTASFAANALAIPFAKRFLVTDWDYVTVTETITAGQAPPATTIVATTTAQAQVQEQEVVETQVAETTVYQAYYAENEAFTSTYAPAETTYAVESSAEATTIVVTPSAESVAEQAVSTAAAVTTSEVATSAATTAAATTTAAASSGFALASICATPASSEIPSAATLTATPTSEVQRLWLAYHNVHRSNHTGTCSLYWDYDLEESAQEWADTCTYSHNTTIGSSYSSDDSTTWYGQNGGMYSESLSDTKAAVMFSNMYYQEGANYTNAYGASDPEEGSNVPEGADIGHFTQMVWKNTYAVGCASKDCSQVVGSSVGYVTWCNYRVTGNIATEYADNVADIIDTPLAPVCTDYDVDGCIAEADFV